MGMMLETTSRRLFAEPGQVHYGSPDKDPAVRLQVIEDAGAAGIPFTTGILVGIGETLQDRAESLIALRELHERHGHVQEVIVQNFRAKPGTAMRGAPDAEPARVPRRHRGGPAGDGAAHADPGAAEPVGCRRARPAGPRGRRRLGRCLAADRRPRQPGAPLAGAGQARRPHRRARLRAARAAHRAPRVRAGC
ncbi:hypothetical protein [Microbacterium elymi]|uniref:hypothetical protein n=1 Tax=Microbacterium elymi TaxID=2909587 RepID=UPI00338E3DE8